MHDSVMDLTTLTYRTDLMTLITERGQVSWEFKSTIFIFWKVRIFYWSKWREKNTSYYMKERSRFWNVSQTFQIPEQMSLHHQETNLEKQTGQVLGEWDERRTIIIHDRPNIIHPRHLKEAGLNPSRPITWKMKEACPTTSGKQELKGQNNLGEKCQDTV